MARNADDVLLTVLVGVTEVEYRALRLEQVVLVGVWTDATLEQAENSLRELALLAETAGSEVLEGLIQRRAKADPATRIGLGKTEWSKFREIDLPSWPRSSTTSAQSTATTPSTPPIEAPRLGIPSPGPSLTTPKTTHHLHTPNATSTPRMRRRTMPAHLNSTERVDGPCPLT
ncbi:hypothetical protein GCM10009550_39710 [Actinocorallia libanotica]|uniref:GTPase HflX N-terminal domain-containing protein n=1 Tax=Actinocorallia libanotica TaxID=46162 RepID=A0ABP4BX30_9ACTN